jgi:hypothetical protein
MQRCCCEIGKFNCCEFIWYSHCAFHLVWAVCGLVWLAWLPVESSPYEQVDVPGWEVPALVWKTVLASVIMDFTLAGSELFHRVKLHYARNNPGSQDPAEEGEMLKQQTQVGGGQQYQHGGGGQQYQHGGGGQQYQHQL